MAETITLDPSTVAVDRTALEINSGAITVRVDGVDWGNAEIEAVMADQERGSSPVDYRIPNRQITIPLRLRADGTVTFTQARTKLQQKVALLQREGGWIGRTVSGGGTVYADVVNAGLTLSGGWLQDHSSIDAEAELRLEVIPDFYEDEITLSDHSETTLPELKFTETAISGDYPARVRMVVDEDDGEDQASLLWCVRSRHYSSDSTAAAAYQAEALEPLDAATRENDSTLDTPASGGSIVYHASIAEDWTPVLGTNIGGTSYMTHTGAYRVWARVYSYGGTTDARFVWDVGDLVTPTENSAVSIPAQANSYFMVDLGEIRLDKVQTGTHRWAGQLQARGGGTVAVDRIYFFNTDEGYGMGQASSNASNFSPFVARDSFDQTSGTLTGKVLPTGGTWAGAGDTDGFGINTTSHMAQRTALNDSDAGGHTGRLAIAGTATYDDVTVQGDFYWTAHPTSGEYLYTGVIARYVDSSNWAGAFIGQVGTSLQFIGFVVTIGGVSWSATYDSPYFAIPSYTHRIGLTINSRGEYDITWGLPQNGVNQRSVLSGWGGGWFQSGGTLETGKVGFYDMYTDPSTANTRLVNNFLATAPTLDAATFANQSAEVSTFGINREDSTGAAYGPISQITGDLPRLPTAGLDGRSTEVMVKLSRGDLSTSADSGIDDVSAQLHYRPSWLFVPD